MRLSDYLFLPIFNIVIKIQLTVNQPNVSHAHMRQSMNRNGAKREQANLYKNLYAIHNIQIGALCLMNNEKKMIIKM